MRKPVLKKFESHPDHDQIFLKVRVFLYLTEALRSFFIASMSTLNSMLAKLSERGLTKAWAATRRTACTDVTALVEYSTPRFTKI